MSTENWITVKYWWPRLHAPENQRLPLKIHQTEWSCGSCQITIHYNDVIMGVMASQITSLTIVYSTVYSGVDQRKHQSSASLAFVRGIHRGPVNSQHKWSVTRKIFPFDDVIVILLETKFAVFKMKKTVMIVTSTHSPLTTVWSVGYFLTCAVTLAIRFVMTVSVMQWVLQREQYVPCFHKTISLGMGIPMIKIGRSRDRLCLYHGDPYIGKTQS